jgi:tRNA threonylcarbamoyl adenosine modification protein (Sua5/YciO/YrdC/YwlC family)
VAALSSPDEALSALRAGECVVLPTDTVYGLCVDPLREEAVERLVSLKRRPADMPVALVAAHFAALVEVVPELEDAAPVAIALLPGPYTLVLPNPMRRLPLLSGAHPETIGVRVPDLPVEASAVLEDFGAVAATSANVHGEPDPAQVADLSEELRDGVAAIVDAGPLPGTPSTVVDLTGAEPRILREGAVPAADALAAIAAAGPG